MVGTPGSASLLVVEDDDDTRAALRESLERGGFSVVEAGTGRSALDRLTTSQGPIPNAIICDLEMPIMSGWDLLAVIKNYARLAGIPVIIVSGYDVNRQRLDEIGHPAIAAILRKPLDADEFVAIVKRCARS